MSTNDVLRRLLMWLVDNVDPSGMGKPYEFLEGSPEVDGQEITEPQLVRAIERAEEYGLVKGHRSMGPRLPYSLKLLPPGFECAEMHGGDLQRFVDAQRGPAGVANTFHVEGGNYGSLAGFTGGGDVEQTSHVTITNSPERLRLAADAIEEVLPLYPRVQNRAEIESAVQGVRDAADNGDEETRASAGARLAAAIMTLSGVSTVGRVVFDLLNGSGLFG